MTGIPESAFSVSPKNIDILNPGESSLFSLNIYPQHTTSNTHTVTLSFISDEISETSSFVLDVLMPGDVKGNGYIDRAKSIISSIIILLLVVIIASVLILVIMLVLFKAKRCPLCGAKLVKEYEGKNYVSFKCSRCKYYKYKIKKGS